MKTFSLFILASIFLCSCASDANILFPTEFVQNNDVIINGDIDLKEFVGAEEFSSFEVSKGDISVSINGKVTDVNVNKSGLLNLNKEQYVIFPIYYGESFMVSWSGTPRPILIDSVLYYNSEIASRGVSDLLETANKHADEPYNPEKSKELELVLINEDVMFVEKNWEIDINEEIPDQIEVRVSKESGGSTMNVRTWRRTIKKANYFKIYCLLSEDFEATDLTKSTE